MADDDALRRQDVTCPECGARSRAGYAVPAENCPESMPDFGRDPLRPHDWQPTEEVEP